MLESLADYAKRKGLMVEAGFAAKQINWIANVNSKGNLTGVTLSDTGKQKSKFFSTCPNLQQPELASLPTALSRIEADLNLKQAAQFLADTCETIVLLSNDDREQRNREKHKTFVHLIARASQSVPKLKAVAAFFQKTKQVQMLQHQLTDKNAKPHHLLTFAVNGYCILESSDWHSWWKALYQECFIPQSGRKMLCLVTGEPVIPARVHPKLSTLAKIGALSYGANLISFDKAAFGSYQLVKGENSAVDSNHATAYTSALDHLLRDAQIIGSSKMIHWYDTDVDSMSDPITVVFDAADELNVIKALDHILEQLHLSSSQAVRFHFAVVSATQGRAAIKLYLHGSALEATQALLTWCKDFCITQATGIGEFTPKPTQLINSMLESLHILSAEKARDLGRFSFEMYWWQVLFDSRKNIPNFLVDYCLKAICQSITKRTFIPAMSRQHPTTTARIDVHLFMGVLRAYLVRLGDTETGVSINPEHSSFHYQFGRLLAQLEITSNIANKTFNRMDMHQALLRAIHNNLFAIQYRIQSIQGDLKKIQQIQPWLAFRYEEKFSRIWTRLNQAIPTFNTYKEKSEVALGYYQQYSSDNSSPDDEIDLVDEVSSPWEEL